MTGTADASQRGSQPRPPPTEHPHFTSWGEYAHVLSVAFLVDARGGPRDYCRSAEESTLNLRAGVMSFARGDLGLAEARLRRSWTGARTAEAAYYLGILCVSSDRPREARMFFVQAVVLDGPGIWREEELGTWRSMATKDLTSRGSPAAIMHLPTPR
jgi:hypothetical protein